MKILEVCFTVEASQHGSLIIEFAYRPAPLVRVWKRADFGSDRRPVLELPNGRRSHKPCATHVLHLIDLALAASEVTR